MLDQSLRILAIPSKKTDTVLISYLSTEEIQAILNVPDIRTRAGISDRAMLNICLAVGLRVSELTGLLLSSVTLQPTPTIRVVGKGRRKVRCPYGGELGWRCGVIYPRQHCSSMHAGKR